MKEAEEAIEKTLAGLGDCDPPPGMERRILQAVQDRDAATARSGERRWLLMFPNKVAALGAAVAAVLAVALAIPSMQKSWRVPTQTAVRSMPSRLTLPAPSAEIAGRNAATLSPQPTRTPIARRTRMVRKPAPLAVREMLAASRPAPQVPLTREEKLLLRVIRTSDPAQLAMLNPVARARQAAESRADFQKFFGLATTGDTE